MSRQLKLAHAYPSKDTPVSISPWCLNLIAPTDFLSKHFTENERPSSQLSTVWAAGAGAACMTMPEAARGMQLWGWKVVSDADCSVPAVRG